jgi:membrane fusion protein, multidrug efflux system
LTRFQTPFLRSGWTRLIVLVVVVLGGYFGWRHVENGKTPPAPPPPAIPVTVATIQKADFPVYLNSLGTVEPYETVTVSSRVDGEITSVAFKQGQMVKQGDILVEIDPRPYQAALGQAVAKKAQDEANLKNAALNLQRFSTLASKDFASRQQVDTQQAAVDQLIAQIGGDQAAIDNAQTQVSYTTIRSPTDGKAGFRLVDPGNIVHAATTTGIVTIAKLQPISVVFTAPEQDIPQINKALTVGPVPVTALSSDGLTALSQGTLALVNNQVDQASGAIRMKATFANKDNALWPGLSVSTRLLVETLPQVTVIGDDAIQHGPDGLFAYVVGAGNKAAMQVITIGPDGGGNAVVLTGLSAGQTIVTAGQYRLQAGSLVEPTTAAPAAAAPTPAAPAPTPAGQAPAAPAPAAPGPAVAKAP